MRTRSSVNRPQAAEANDHRIIIININTVGTKNGIGTSDIPTFVSRDRWCGEMTTIKGICNVGQQDTVVHILRLVRRVFGGLLVMTTGVGGPVVGCCWIFGIAAGVVALLAVMVPVVPTAFHDGKPPFNANKMNDAGV